MSPEWSFIYIYNLLRSLLVPTDDATYRDRVSSFRLYVLMEVLVAAATMAANATKAVESAKSLALCQEKGSSNIMFIKNDTGEEIRLRQHYIFRGKAKVVLGPSIINNCQDEAVFKSSGKFNPSGSSGIVTYELSEKIFLHIMWDCPYSRFKKTNKFIGLFLCNEPEVHPNETLFLRMHQPRTRASLTSKCHFIYDLVCCGSEGGKPAGFHNITWGCRRPCEVENGTYHVIMTMGNSNHTTSKVTIKRKK
ncbi:hypothetical protein SK128_006258 [Halocaridina rubra]|uniref:Uncharacterized protein n=1 Tax=Halocaridina rubra TaxID=373956 RepID=A0AAN8XBN8_HALRR